MIDVILNILNITGKPWHDKEGIIGLEIRGGVVFKENQQSP
jgi:hypothetical protein